MAARNTWISTLLYTRERLLIITMRLLALFPLRVRILGGRILGSLYSYLPTKGRRVASLQIRNFLPQANHKAMIKKLYQHFGEVAFESINLGSYLRNEDSIKYPEKELLETARNFPGPVIGLTAHLGNWELLGACLAKAGLPMTTIGRASRNSILQIVLENLRRTYGVTTLWRTSQGNGREILRVFKEKTILGVVIDQDTRVRSQLINFFGCPAATPETLATLGIKNGALFYSAFCVKVAPLRYELIIEPLDTTGGAQQLLEEYNYRLENIIRKYPEQWVWFHKRWRTDSSGNRRSHNEYLNWLEDRLVKSEAR